MRILLNNKTIKATVRTFDFLNAKLKAILYPYDVLILH
ncbi:hypothetical protein IGI43_000843 [Enterococcus sp. AZ126]